MKTNGFIMRELLASILLIPFVTTTFAAEPDGGKKENAKQPRYVIVVHGGAGGKPKDLPEEEKQRYYESMKQAIGAGRKVLAEGGTSVDAVERAIRQMEDDPRLNAGKGGVFTSAGRHELDASIMDGKDLSCGAVAGVKTVKNPISLARLVMDKTPQVLYAGKGADQLAEKLKVERVEPDYFFTPKLRAKWKSLQEQRDAGKRGAIKTESAFGTVGVVALDMHGNLAAGTSTGGLTLKPPGRVGDSPIIGAGTYADNATCAVSCTGHGEEFIRRAIAFDVSARMRYNGQTVAEAARQVIHKTLKPNTGGLIALSRNGQVAMEYNTSAMLRAMADSEGRLVVKIWE